MRIVEIFLIALFVSITCTNSNLAVSLNTNNQLDSTKIHELRLKGKSYLLSQDYEKAAECYSAILQVVEGIGGEESAEVRRRCSLTLAECEVKLGNLYNAIARCSEVIDESPKFSQEIFNSSIEIVNSTVVESKINLKLAIGKALYRRGIALKRMNKSLLALLDFKESLLYLPNDSKLILEIATIETNKELMIENKLNTLDELQEELFDIVNEAQFNYPRITLSKKQISSLLLKSNKFADTGENSLQNFNSFGDMSSMFGGDNFKNNMPDFSTLGGSNFNFNSFSTLMSLFSGVDSKLIAQVVEIYKAIGDSVKVFKNLFAKFEEKKKIIMVVSFLLWLLFSLIPLFHMIKLF
jgi:tetratricopeptide (TPR) repeat protein